MSSQPPLIPRERLFGNPANASPQLSPCGRWLAWLAPDEGVLNIWVREFAGADARPVTYDRHRGVRMFTWTYLPNLLLFLQDSGGDENWHVHAVDVGAERPESRDLTPMPQVQARLIGLDHSEPGAALVALNSRDARLHDVFRADLLTGMLVECAQNPGDVVDWTADSKLNVLGATATFPDGSSELRFRPTPNGEWRKLAAWGPDEELSPHAISRDGHLFYVGTDIGTETSEFHSINLYTGAEQVVAAATDVDMGGVLWHPFTGEPQAVGFLRDRLEWQVMDASIEADLEFLKKSRRGEVRIASRDLADTEWIVLYSADTAPASWFTYTRATRALTHLFDARPDLAGTALAEMEPVTVTSRDGLTLHCYLTLPPGIPPVDLPMVVRVHGGPWARDTWGFAPEAQWLANRGYACLMVNFRGSTGYGKRFLHSGDREWGAKMHDDLIDCVYHAVGKGVADPARVGIYGGSYGGYAALVGAAFTPKMFACAIDVVGPSNLNTLIRTIPPYWEPLKRIFTLRVGDPDTEEEFLESRSPLNFVDRICRPLLIAQGANDPRVKQAESEQIVEALRAGGREVEYMLFEDEGHGFARPENRLKFYAAAEAFLAKHLGGRTES